MVEGAGEGALTLPREAWAGAKPTPPLPPTGAGGGEPGPRVSGFVTPRFRENGRTWRPTPPLTLAGAGGGEPGPRVSALAPPLAGMSG